jgi:hypothetical protein
MDTEWAILQLLVLKEKLESHGIFYSFEIGHHSPFRNTSSSYIFNKDTEFRIDIGYSLSSYQFQARCRNSSNTLIFNDILVGFDKIISSFRDSIKYESERLLTHYQIRSEVLEAAINKLPVNS